MLDDKYYVVNERFEKIKHVLQGMFWDDMAMLKSSKGIKAALQKSPKARNINDSSQITEYFSHVIIYLSADVIETDRRVHGRRYVKSLCQTFETIHREHFQQFTGSGEMIRYQVRPGEGVPATEVVIAFGRCVYLAEANEKPSYQLNFEAGEEKSITSISIYPKQRLLLVNANPYGAQQAISDWPFAEGVSILIIQDVSTGDLELVAEPSDALDISYNDAEQRYYISDATGALVKLQISPVEDELFTTDEEKALSLSGRVGQNVSHTRTLDERTFNAFEPMPEIAKFELLALPLLRLSLFQKYGFQQLRIGFSCLGNIIAPDNAEAVGVLLVDAEDTVQLQVGSEQLPITLPYQWDIADGITVVLDLPPDGLAEEYVVSIRLVTPILFDLSKGKELMFGRDATVDIAPLLLAEGQILSDHREIVSAERLGLSGKTAKLKVNNNSLEVLNVGNSSLWHLNEQGNVVSKIEEKPGHILPKEHFLSGHYLFRFLGID